MISSVGAFVTKYTLISTLSLISESEALRIAEIKISELRTDSVIIITSIEESETKAFLVKLKKPLRIILLIFTQSIVI
jgi:hypothetical protein